MPTRYTARGARRRAPPSEFACHAPDDGIARVANPGGALDSFCEEDYVVTRYVAEFINSLTNLAYST